MKLYARNNILLKELKISDLESFIFWSNIPFLGTAFMRFSKCFFFQFSVVGLYSASTTIKKLPSALFFFNKFYNTFCRRHSLMDWPWYNNLFQFMQHVNFQNINRVIFTHWKHLQPWVNAFWYCSPVIKRYFFHYLMKSAPIPGNQSSFEILQLFNIWHYQSLVISFFSSVVILI